MMFIFEDKASMPVSTLLSSSSPYHCEFTEKNSRLKSFLKTLNTDTEGVMFIDVNPLNSSSVILYTQLRNELKKYRKMLLVPIVCIEEHVIEMLSYIKGMDSLFDFNSILNTRKHALYKDGQSLEVSLKSILSTDSKLYYCLKNRCTTRSEYAGLFYKQDCDKNCPAINDFDSCPLLDFPLQFGLKGILLWLCLPVMFSYTGCAQHATLTGLAENVSRERISYYTKLCDTLGINVPKWVSNINVYPYSIPAIKAEQTT